MSARTRLQEASRLQRAGCRAAGCMQEVSSKQESSYNQPLDLYHKSMRGRVHALKRPVPSIHQLREVFFETRFVERQHPRLRLERLLQVRLR
eukprot:6995247-Lingulodinium_polyedra.AAC.1